MSSLETFGHDLIRWLQETTPPAMDGVARGFSFLGDEEFYLLLLPILVWTVSRQVGLRLTVLLMVSVWINAVLKALAGLPRPDPALVEVLITESAGGLPSGHAQNAVVVWGFLAVVLLRGGGGDRLDPDDLDDRGEVGGGRRTIDSGGARRKRGPRRESAPALHVRPITILASAVGLILLIGWSRLQLGVHLPHDLLAGWLAGGLLLALFLALEGRGLMEPERFRTGGARLLILLPLAMLLLYREHTALPAASALLGAGIGMMLPAAGRSPAPPDGLALRLLRMGLGLAVVAVLWFGVLALPLPGEDGPRIFRYLLLGIWLTGGAPLLFRRMGI